VTDTEAKWLRITFRVDASYYDSLSDLLEACLALAVTIENAGEDDFLEVAFPKRPDWEKLTVSALFYDGVDTEQIIQFVSDTLFEGRPIPAVIDRFEDQNWERVWLAQFKPLHVGGDLWICPTWCDTPKEAGTTLYLDPGLAFGTGTHETTFMCLQWIAENNVKDKTVLDFGAGSGILAIAALLKGAKNAIATDIDPLAVEATIDNARKNDVLDQVTSVLPHEIPQNAKYDIVFANILAEVIIENKELLLNSLGEQGILVLSGLLSHQIPLVEKCFDSMLDIEEIILNDWVVLVGSMK